MNIQSHAILTFFLLLRHDDAYAHFRPFSDIRVASPVSCRDPAHHGRIASVCELLLVLAAAVLTWRRLETLWAESCWCWRCPA